jgi:putative aldouronate transport system substrate-binding protein
MKQVVAAVLTLCLLLVIGNAVGEKYDPPVTITVGRSVQSTWTYPEGDDLNNNIWYREYRDNMGIEIKHAWTVLSADYSNKVNVIIASGDIPDLFQVSASQLQTLVEADMLCDLTEIFDSYASDFTKSLLYGDGGLAMGSATFNDRLYALPYVNANFYEPSLLWIRQDWLDNLGLKVPATISEVLAVAKAFKENDPDMDGKDNTGGIAFSNYLFDGITSLIGFFNGFHAYPNTWVTQADGSVVFGSTLPEMKAALGALAQAYKDGLIDTEFAVKDSSKVSEEIIGGKYGISYGQNWNIYQYGIGLSADPDMIWTPVAAPSADETQSKASVGFSTGAYYVVSKQCKNPEAVVKMLNTQTEIIYGSRRNEPDFISVWQDGTTIQQHHLAVVGTSTPDNLTEYALRQLVTAVVERNPELLKDCVTETDKYQPCIEYMDSGNNDYYMQYHQVKAFQVLVNEYPLDRLVRTAFGGVTETMSAKMGILSNYLTEMFTKIIMGEEPLDAFDTAINEWYRMGGDIITQEVNDWVALH